jgi:hypothetical protein
MKPRPYAQPAQRSDVPVVLADLFGAAFLAARGRKLRGGMEYTG